MFLLLLKITDTKTGEYVISRHITKNTSDGTWPDVPWLNRHNNKQRLERKILHFAVDYHDLYQMEHRVRGMFHDDPLNRTDFIPPVIKRSPRSNEAKEKQRKAMKGRKYSAKHRKNMSDAVKRSFDNGRPPVISYHNADNTAAMNAKIKKNPYNVDRPKVKCPHCYKIVSINMYHRWHGDNCRNNW